MTSHKKKPQSSGGRAPRAAAASATQSRALPPHLIRWGGLAPYALGFVLLWVFATWVYGSVFQRAEQESFVVLDAETMKFLTDQAGGRFYAAARVALLVFKSAMLGGFCLALIGTLTARLADGLLRLPRAWRGSGFVLPFLVMAFFVWRGLDLYYFNEPSIVMWLPLTLLLAVAVAAGLTALLRRRCPTPATDAPATRTAAMALHGSTVVLVLGAGLYAYALTAGQNTRLAADMQLRTARADWQGVLDDALAARRPTRTIAAYHAIALVQTGQLLERLFELPYNYPERLPRNDESNDEGFNYIPDCNFYAGLINSSYRSCMEKTVQGGPSLFTLKRMAVCAIMNGEKALAQKYLHIIGRTPFEHDFVERYAPMAEKPELADADPELATVRGLEPLERKFEQEYRPIAFLGYNTGVLSGTNATLTTSMAAALYSKDLANVALRAGYLRGVRSLPATVRQALALAAFRDPSILDRFPEVDEMTRSQVAAFLKAAVPYKDNFAEMAKALRKEWLGTYMYYYYCGNLTAPTQAGPAAPSKKGGVN